MHTNDTTATSPNAGEFRVPVSQPNPYAGLPPLLKYDQVARLVGFTVRHLQRLAVTGQMPKKVHVGDTDEVRFRLDEIVEWIANDCKWPVGKAE